MVTDFVKAEEKDGEEENLQYYVLDFEKSVAELEEFVRVMRRIQDIPPSSK